MLRVLSLHCFFLSLAWSLSGDNVAPSRNLAFSTSTSTYGDSGIYRANTIGGLVLLFYMTILCKKSDSVMAVNKVIYSE